MAFSKITDGLRNLFSKSEADRELDDEVHGYVEEAARQKMKRGIGREDALREARLELGGAERVKEEVRSFGWEAIVGNLWQDLRFGARMLRKNPGFTAIAVLTLALGIGATTAIFSVANVILLKPLPFRNPDRLVLVWEVNAHDPTDISILSAPNFWGWQRQNSVFESMAIFDSAGRGYNLSQGSEPERVSGVRVSADFFRVLGIEPMLGRAFRPEEEIAGRDHEVVLSYGLWQRRYAGDPGIVGKMIRVDGEDFSVIGVMPKDFRFAFGSTQRQLWVPVGYTDGDRARDSQSFDCIARLKPGIT